jgi:DNA-binding MarR family transcriptional regulator
VLKLTPGGERLHGKLEPIRQQVSDQLFGTLSKSEQAQLVTLLSKLNGRLTVIENEMKNNAV